MPLVAGAAADWDVSLLGGLSDGDPVSTLTEQVAAVNFTGVTTTRPLYKTAIFPTGLPALLFDGTDDTMATGSSADFDFDDSGTLFAVVHRQASGGTRQTLFGGETTDFLQLEFGIGSGAGTNRIGIIKPGVFLYETVDAALATGVPAVISYVRSGTNTNAVRVNGTLIGTQASTNAATVDTGTTRRLGTRTATSQPYKGYVGQLVLYSTALSAGDVSDNEAFLTAKWLTAAPGPPPPPLRHRPRIVPGLIYR